MVDSYNCLLGSGYTTKQIATHKTSRLGITMAGRILGSYVGSTIPIG